MAKDNSIQELGRTANPQQHAAESWDAVKREVWDRLLSQLCEPDCTEEEREEAITMAFIGRYEEEIRLLVAKRSAQGN